MCFHSRVDDPAINSSEIEEQVFVTAVNGFVMGNNSNIGNFYDLLRKQRGKAASWLVALVGVAGYTYWTNRDNGQTFSKEEQSNWNAGKEKK